MGEVSGMKFNMTSRSGREGERGAGKHLGNEYGGSDIATAPSPPLTGIWTRSSFAGLAERGGYLVREYTRHDGDVA